MLIIVILMIMVIEFVWVMGGMFVGVINFKFCYKLFLDFSSIIVKDLFYNLMLVVGCLGCFFFK